MARMYLFNSLQIGIKISIGILVFKRSRWKWPKAYAYYITKFKTLFSSVAHPAPISKLQLL